jgi:predicted ArsR family transcriptional regulator
MLTSVLLGAAAAGGLDGEEVADAAREQGRADARRWPDGSAALDVVMVEQARLGFDPEVAEDEHTATVAFAHCPFRALAEAHPDLVCRVHCGLIEGLVDELGGAEVSEFHSLVDRTPCQVDLVTQ